MADSVDHEQAVMGLISMLMRKPHPTTLDMLVEELSLLPPSDYMWMNVLLLQLYQWLNQEATNAASTQLVEQLLAALDKALHACRIEKVQQSETQCFKLLQCMLQLMPTMDEKSTACVLTDEGRMTALRCIERLCTTPTPPKFLSTSVPFVAFMVSTLVLRAQKDLNRTCRVNAVRALSVVVRAVDDAQVLTQVFPGLSSALFQLVQSDFKLGSKLPKEALNCLTHATVLVLQDQRCQGLVTLPEFTLEPAVEPTRVAPSPLVASGDLPKILRSSDWLATTQMNMEVLVTHVCRQQRHHAKPNVRHALVHFCTALLVHCRLSLPSCFIPCYETILALAQDPIAAIHEDAVIALAKLDADMTPSELVLVQTQAGARFLFHVESLAKKCAVEIDLEREALATLQICAGYLTHMRSTHVVLSTQVDRVLRGWCKILTIDAVDAQVLTHVNFGSACTAAYYRKRFLHFRTDDAIQAALSVVRLMGANGSILSFADAIFDQLHNNAQPRSNELLVLLNQFVLGAAHIQVSHASCPSLDIHVAGYILDKLLELPFWTSDDANDEAQSLLLEIVGSVAQALTMAFNPLLMHVLYPVVEQLGRSSALVHQAAVATLKRLAWFGGFGTVPNLLHVNMDYVIDMLVNRLQHLDDYPETPSVVHGLLQQAGPAPLPLLEEAVRGVLGSMDAHVTSREHALGLLRVMKVIMANQPKPSQETPPAKPNAVAAFISDMNALFHIDDYEEPPPEASKEEEEPSMEEKMKGAMPVEFDPEQPLDEATLHGMSKLVHDIVVRCTYFIAAPDVATSCLAWQVLQEALATFASKDLRPLVHRIWPMLTRRLASSSSKPMLLAAVQCLSSLARLCGDFLGDKFVETLWPLFQFFMNQHAASPTMALADLTLQDKEEPQALRLHNLTDQILLHMLVCIESMCNATHSVSSITLELASACQPFLAASMPTQLQDQGRAVFAALARLNGDQLFPRLAYMASLALPPPPSSAFPSYKEDAIAKIQDKVHQPALYARNARRLVLHDMAPTWRRDMV
ncbi:unnamed protein product [Aphanomyces euteiches]